MNPRLETARQIIENAKSRERASRLNLSNLGLTELPENFYELTGLTQIDLSKNKLSSLDEKISGFTKLREIIFDNGICPTGISNIPSLQILEANNCQLSEFPAEFLQINALEELNLNQNLIEAIPEGISELKKLRKLSLQSNLLDKFPFPICSLSNLKVLDLSLNDLDVIPDEISQINELIVLILRKNKLNNLPSSLSELTHLRSLDISENTFVKFPNWLPDLTAIQELYLNGEVIPDLPERYFKWFEEIEHDWEFENPELNEKKAPILNHIANDGIDPEDLNNILISCLENSIPKDESTNYEELLDPLNFNWSTLMELVQVMKKREKRRIAVRVNNLENELTEFKSRAESILNEINIQWKIFTGSFSTPDEIRFLVEHGEAKKALDVLEKMVLDEIKSTSDETVILNLSDLRDSITNLKNRLYRYKKAIRDETILPSEKTDLHKVELQTIQLAEDLSDLASEMYEEY